MNSTALRGRPWSARLREMVPTGSADELRRRGLLRSAFAFVWLAFACSMLVLACTKRKELTFEITVPAAVEADTRWIEISVWPNLQCRLAGRLAYGEAPVNGPVRRILFDPGAEGEKPPSIGDLEPGYYAFMVQVKNANCQIIARGCQGGNIDELSNIRVDTEADDVVGGGCDETMRCELGQCIPKRGGTNCSFDLLGTGPLTQTTIGSTSSLYVPAPTTVSIRNSFLVGYGQYDGTDGTSTDAVLQPVARSGGLKSYLSRKFLERCPDVEQDDGVGLAWDPNDQAGVMVLSRTSCTGGNASGSLDVFGFNADVRDSLNPTNIAIPGATSVKLGRNHAVGALGNNLWLTTPLINAEANAYLFEGTGAGFRDFDKVGYLRFGLPNTYQLDAKAAIGDSVALVALNDETSSPPPPPEDAGSDASTDEVDADAAPQGALEIRQLDGEDEDQPSGTVTVHFVTRDELVSQDTTPATLREPALIENSRFVSAVMVNNRAYVVTDGPSTQEPYLNTIDFNPNASSATPPTVQPYPILVNGEAGKIAYADVDVWEDRVFVATAMAGDIFVTVMNNASTIPETLRTVRLSQLRAASVAGIRDGRVTIRADQKRVFVAWATKRKLGGSDPIGGYAVFSCE